MRTDRKNKGGAYVPSVGKNMEGQSSGARCGGRRGDDTRTHKVFHTLDELCREFDLGRPIWLERNIREFQRHSKTRFHQDSFIEEIDFDYLEIQILEE